MGREWDLDSTADFSDAAQKRPWRDELATPVLLAYAFRRREK